MSAFVAHLAGITVVLIVDMEELSLAERMALKGIDLSGVTGATSNRTALSPKNAASLPEYEAESKLNEIKKHRMEAGSEVALLSLPHSQSAV